MTPSVLAMTTHVRGMEGTGLMGWLDDSGGAYTVVTQMRERLVWVTANAAPVDHAVTDAAMVAGMSAQGRYLGLCGAWFLPAPMTAAPGRACAGCRSYIRTQASLPSAEHWTSRRRHRRLALPGAFARLLTALRVCESSVVSSPRPAAAVDAKSPPRRPNQVHGGTGLTTAKLAPGPAVSHLRRPDWG